LSLTPSDNPARAALILLRGKLKDGEIGQFSESESGSAAADPRQPDSRTWAPLNACAHCLPPALPTEEAPNKVPRNIYFPGLVDRMGREMPDTKRANLQGVV